MRIGSLFSGIGGLELGLEWGIPGAHTIWQVEQDPYARAVLAKHWPHATRYEDVRLVGREQLAPVDIVCGGFPCQDISLAGKGAGLDGERSGLWFEYARIIEELEPWCVVAENVSDLRSRGLDRVLGSLAALGYDAEWHCIPASYVGAPHRRDRIYIVAYAIGPGLEGHAGHGPLLGERGRLNPGSDGPARAEGVRQGEHAAGWWAVEPDVGRVAHGVPARVDRLKCLGNAVVPQVAEVIGRMIADREGLTALPLAA